MNLLEIKNQIMYQTNNDAEDLGDFMPHLNAYINEGYDKLVQAWCGEHVDVDNDHYPPLTHDKSMPELPGWTHRAIVDWATWLVYRNGNTGKQNRGVVFRAAAESMHATIAGMMDDEKVVARSTAAKSKRYIHNIPL